MYQRYSGLCILHFQKAEHISALSDKAFFLSFSEPSDLRKLTEAVGSLISEAKKYGIYFYHVCESAALCVLGSFFLDLNFSLKLASQMTCKYFPFSRTLNLNLTLSKCLFYFSSSLTCKHFLKEPQSFPACHQEVIFCRPCLEDPLRNQETQPCLSKPPLGFKKGKAKRGL